MTPRPLRHGPRRGAAVLALALAAVVAGCAALPPRGEVPAARALPAAEAAATPLGRLAAASLPADAAPPASGFRLLPTGEYALEARLALAARATRTLDLQIYHLHRDQAGRALLRALRDAAARGVRVRLLADDFYAAEVDGLLAGLAAHEGVQVRLFNPLSLRWGTPLWRLALSRGDFELNNHRMHNKLFVADGAMALFGGRNVADEYYMGSEEANFIDMDLLATGAVVGELSAVFDRYWNSAQAWPIERVLPRAADAPARAQARRDFDAAVRDAPLPRARYARDPLGRGPLGEQLAAALPGGRLDGLAWAPARVHADPPEKAAQATPGHDPSEAMAGLMRAMATARRYVAIVSPYFVPNEAALAGMREARRHGIRIIVVTNSLASTDEPLVHASYAQRRPELLKMGVELHEISPALVQRSEHYGAFGRSVPRLHAKVAIVDGLRVLVGSVNLDARSAIGNTEMGVVIESPALAAELQQLMQASSSPQAHTAAPALAMYRVTLAEDGQTLQWRSRGPDGQEQISTDEPGSSAWLRFKLWLQQWVVPERLL